MIKAEHKREHTSYSKAKLRCESPKDNRYQYYGAKGIEFRFNSFQEFLAEVGLKPSSVHTLDRINVKGHYEKGNIRWATQAEQQRNRSNNLYISCCGERLTLKDWANKLNTSRQVLAHRLNLGWCNQCTVSIPVKKGVCVHKN